MKIAGLQKLSLVDFPGNLSAVIFLHGCNFSCGYCHNPDLTGCGDAVDFIDEKKVITDLKTRRKMIDGVVITGGEPTIHPELPELFEKLKDTELMLKLDTNGSNPDMIDRFFRSWMLDFIAVDIKTSFDKYSLFTKDKKIGEKLLKSVHLTMLSTVKYEFRTTCVPGIVDEEDIRNIGKDVKGAKKYSLQQFRPSNTLDKEFENIKPYSKEKLFRFRDILSEYVNEVEIRGV